MSLSTVCSSLVIISVPSGALVVRLKLSTAFCMMFVIVSSFSLLTFQFSGSLVRHLFIVLFHSSSIPARKDWMSSFELWKSLTASFSALFFAFLVALSSLG